MSALRALQGSLCALCAECGPLAAAMLTLGLLFAVLSCPAWTLGVWLPHPVLGAVVAAEGMHRLRRIHASQAPPWSLEMA